MLLLLRLERKQTNSWNPFRVRIFLFLSLILTWNWNDKYLPYTPVVPSKTTPDSRLKWAKCIPVFRPKLRKNPTQWSGTCLYSLHKAVPPGGTPINGLDGFSRVSIGIKNTGYHFALVATVFPVWSHLQSQGKATWGRGCVIISAKVHLRKCPATWETNPLLKLNVTLQFRKAIKRRFESV